MFQFNQCTLNANIYSVPSTPGSQLMFVECQDTYINSLNSSVNLENTIIWIANSDMSISGTVQIGDYVYIWATNTRFSQYTDANYFNIQGTNVFIYIRGGYSNYNGGGSGTYYIINTETGATGYVGIEKVEIGNMSSGTTLSITSQTIIPVNTKEITIKPNNTGTVSYSTTPTISAIDLCARTGTGNAVEHGYNRYFAAQKCSLHCAKSSISFCPGTISCSQIINGFP